jgi:hypothetical protein
VTYRVAVAVAASLLLASIGCSGSAPEDGQAQPVEVAREHRGTQQLWSYDLSDRAIRDRTLDDLWRIGVLCLGWAPEVPEGAEKAAVCARLLDAKYRQVGDIGEPERLDEIGYTDAPEH